MNIKKITYILILTAMLIGCSSIDSSQSSNKMPEYLLKIHSDYDISNSLVEMVKKSELIVIGSYQRFDKKWNALRNTQNPLLPHDTKYVEGHIYKFNIEEILKGGAEKEIDVSLVYQRDISYILDETDDQVFMKYPDYVEPVIGEKYILFLNKDKYLDIYGPPTQPFQIKLENGIASLVSNFNGEEYEQDITIDKKFIRVENHLPHIIDNITGLKIDNLIDTIKSLSKN